MEENVRFIEQIIMAEPCFKHKKEPPFPCWTMMTFQGNQVLFAICNSRARRAGMVGKINQSSLSRRSTYKEKK